MFETAGRLLLLKTSMREAYRVERMLTPDAPGGGKSTPPPPPPQKPTPQQKQNTNPPLAVDDSARDGRTAWQRLGESVSGSAT